MFAGVYKIRKLLLPPRLFSMLLHGLVTLSESPDSARKILVMLPDLTNILHSVHSDDKMRALLIFRNVMGHLKKQASSIALELAGQLRHLFDDECSQIRELSICLFKDIIQMADWKDKRQMQRQVRRSLVPLVLHMSDEMESVAKAPQEALWAAAKVLKCKGLSPHVETLERWRTVELLLEQEQSRAEEYVGQSLLYLQHAQVSVRLAAVRFIGLAARCLKDNSRDMLLKVWEVLTTIPRPWCPSHAAWIGQSGAAGQRLRPGHPHRPGHGHWEYR
ncbi:maestro heat-like repeat family member 5 [Neopsephotus bourkii]|uniref:maestro heat-like repeat family member 5 n=1 Tax=Neopsephotus bourkii TaxID=309878 RepID=UPI002AA4FEE5|nr:maestro heat-like repeat family member 5 [Neopsephotus bourkii]